MYLGIDGCPGGWVAVDVTQRWVQVFSTMEALWERMAGHLALALIDIPMGLPADTYRVCDLEARRLLGAKRSSVFLVPCRPAVYAATFPEANALSRQWMGKGVSLQTWNVCSKIREMDQFLHCHGCGQLFRESHPELAFAWLAGGEPLLSKKQGCGGRQERLDLLRAAQPDMGDWLCTAIRTIPNRLARPDDILDAAVLALAAARGEQNLAAVPTPAPLDAMGIPMQIWVPSAEGATK